MTRRSCTVNTRHGSGWSLVDPATGPVILAAFSPDGRRVVTAQAQIGEIRIARI
jgi:hypothetical protein